jgi:hypothetical protein
LCVVARNSSFSVRGKTVNVTEVGRRLGVRYVVEGSVRKPGKRVRVAVQLLDAASGNHLWAEHYDRELEDIFFVQDEITRAVVATLPDRLEDAHSKGQKNDFNDAEAIAEAVQRPTMKFVATKTAEQLDLQALHRVRERLVSQRTGIINQIRAFMLERGIAVRQGIGFLRTEPPTIFATRTDALSPRMLRVIEELAGDWRRLDQRIEGLTGEIQALARQDQACSRLMTVPGIGRGPRRQTR